MSSRLARLLSHQDNVATIAQLVAAGVSAHGVKAHVDARRWTRYGDRCVVTHNSTPTRAQWRWVAVLDNRGPARSPASALEVGGSPSSARAGLIHVVVQRGARYHRFPGVKVHESRRFSPADVVVARGFPASGRPVGHRRGRWQPFPRYACGVLAAVVQQRICSARDLDAALQTVGRVRHKQAMRLAVDDISGGAEALSEIDVADDVPPLRPATATAAAASGGTGRAAGGTSTASGSCEDGRVVVLEVDGSHHVEVEHWEADMKRERGIVISRRTVLRCTANEARHEQAALAGDLARRRRPLPPSCQAVARLERRDRLTTRRRGSGDVAADRQADP